MLKSENTNYALSKKIEMNKIGIRSEMDKIKKYKKESLCETDQGTDDTDNLRLFTVLGYRADDCFKKFLNSKTTFLKQVDPNLLKKWRESIFTTEFLDLDYEFVYEVGKLNRTVLTEYYLLLQDLKRQLKFKTSNKSIIDSFSLCCFNFLEFIVLRFSTRGFISKHKYKYYTGQLEYQESFCNLMDRMLWFFKCIEKRQFFTKRDILNFLEVYVLDEQKLNNFRSNLDIYIEYNSKHKYCVDVTLIFSKLLYSRYIERSFEYDIGLNIEVLKSLAHHKVVSFLQYYNI